MRNARHGAFLVLSMAIPFLVMAAGRPPALAQEPPFEYAVKVVCGVQPEAKDLRLAHGLYATSVNIHNPGATEVRLFKKLALTFPPGSQRPGEVRRLGEDGLGPDQALQTDCVDIQQRAFGGTFPAPNIEGFVVIQSTGSLDVTAVYSTATFPGFHHTSIHVQQIPERRTRQTLADLVPVPGPAGDFCVRQNDKLFVTVRNQGAAAAGSSSTRVDFGAFGTSTMPTPALAAGDSATLVFTIPPTCFDPNCEFRINADALLDVVESDEANNVAAGVCVG
jgi:hypothetical protein